MSDQNQTLPALQQQTRQRVAVTDAEALFDTAQFEHMSRIASMMSRSSMIPDHLAVKVTENGGLVPKNFNGPVFIDREATAANCFLIVNQARLFGGIDPFALAQVSYFVHGRLGYEGKLVQAVLERKIGAMRFEYSGNPGTPQYGITVSAIQPGTDREVSISGTVAEWQTSKSGGGVNQQWTGAAGQTRMLHYRGTREWARLYAPGLTLGLLDDDDLDALREDHRANRARPVDQLSAAPGTSTSAPALSARAFNPMEDAEEAEEPAPAAPATTAAPEPEKPSTVAPSDPAPKPEAKAEPEKPAAPAERRAPRGTPAKVEQIVMSLRAAATTADVRRIMDEVSRPLLAEMAALNVKTDDMRNRLETEAADRIGQLDRAAQEAQAKAAGANPETGEVPHEASGVVAADPDFTPLLADFRTKAREATTFDALDSLVEAMFDAVALPAALDAEVDEVVEENRTRIAVANRQADAEASPEDRETPTEEERFPGDPENKLPPAGAKAAETTQEQPAGEAATEDQGGAPAEDETPLTDDQLQEVVDGWSTGMRKCKTAAELETYNRDVITPFMSGPYQPRINKDQLEDARTTYKNRHKLLTKKEAEQG